MVQWTRTNSYSIASFWHSITTISRMRLAQGACCCAYDGGRKRSETVDVGAEPGGEGGFIEGSGGEGEDGLGGGFFSCREVKTVQLEEKDADEEAGAFIAIDEGVGADDAGDVGSSLVYNVRVAAVGMQLSGPGESRVQQAGIAKARSTPVQGEEAVVEGQGIALVDPDRVTHLARPFRLLREGVQSVAVATDNV